MGVKANLASEAAEVEPVTAAGIENGVVWRCSDDLSDRGKQRRSHPTVVQTAPCGECGSRVTGLFWIADPRGWSRLM